MLDMIPLPTWMLDITHHVDAGHTPPPPTLTSRKSSISRSAPVSSCKGLVLARSTRLQQGLSAHATGI